MREGYVTVAIPGEALAAALSGVQEARYSLPLGDKRTLMVEAAMALADAANAWDLAQIQRRKEEFEATLDDVWEPLGDAAERVTDGLREAAE